MNCICMCICASFDYSMQTIASESKLFTISCRLYSQKRSHERNLANSTQHIRPPSAPSPSHLHKSTQHTPLHTVKGDLRSFYEHLWGLFLLCCGLRLLGSCGYRMCLLPFSRQLSVFLVWSAHVGGLITFYSSAVFSCSRSRDISHFFPFCRSFRAFHLWATHYWSAWARI